MQLSRWNSTQLHLVLVASPPEYRHCIGIESILTFSFAFFSFFAFWFLYSRVQIVVEPSESVVGTGIVCGVILLANHPHSIPLDSASLPMEVAGGCASLVGKLKKHSVLLHIFTNPINIKNIYCLSAVEWLLWPSRNSNGGIHFNVQSIENKLSFFNVNFPIRLLSLWIWLIFDCWSQFSWLITVANS